MLLVLQEVNEAEMIRYPFGAPEEKDYEKTTGKTRRGEGRTLGCQMMDQCADFFEVKGFVDEAVNP